ncbi:HD domain-containing protein [Marispirochaeta aestuarii]|uniref:Phosphatase n=1 Tax=Marispirochaeta aestuarii TaxID=1963862 RepID=A0A1Y1RTG2_9SPIO|nr:HD domain-containing protein [Marispirochaeta aestuarii]ORC30698.1 phosphatase [Marispirochaeta aestuarii]
MNYRLMAVIDIGSTAIRMLIAEIDEHHNWRIVESAGKSIPLGRDAFTTGRIGTKSLRQAVAILKGFVEILKGWSIAPEDVKAIATSAVREASNRDTFIDRVAIQTGIMITIADGIEENRLTYIAVQYALAPISAQISRSNSLIMEVGGGSTELMLLQRNHMVAAHSLKIGTVRTQQQVITSLGHRENMARYIAESVQTLKDHLDREFELKRIKHFVAVGGDARVAASQIGEQKYEYYTIVQKADFNRFVDRISALSIEEIMDSLQIPYATAELLIPGLILYSEFLEATAAEELIVPSISIREGALLSYTLHQGHVVREKFVDQIKASAVSLGRKYHYDEKHARQVTRMALRIFDDLKKDFQLKPEGRLLLEVSGILHDVGTYIRTAGHHKHGQYLVENSDIFGLTREDIQIISNVVRFHRKRAPNPSNESYNRLPRKERLRVLKLAAILRIADALDRGHNDRIKSIRLERDENRLIINCNATGDIAVERAGIAEKKDLFEEVFGLKVILR